MGDDFFAEMVLRLSDGEGEEQVIFVKIKEFNAVKLVRLAGDLADIKALANIRGRDDILVFRNLELYLSTGATVFNHTYERGIHVKGDMEFFKKKGDFNGSLTDDGLTVKAHMDQFNIGGLEVKSASAAEKYRATLDVEMTKEKQKILIDGMISYHDIQAKILVDANTQERRLDADIYIKFIEHLSFQLNAKVEVPQDSSLDKFPADFGAELSPDFYGAIFDGIEQGIEALGKIATQEFDHAVNDLQGQIDEHGKALEKLEEKLKQMKANFREEVTKREKQIANDDDQLKSLRAELDTFKENVKKAEGQKHEKDTEVAHAKAEREAAQRKLKNKIRDMTAKYNEELKEQQDNQQKWQEEKQKLENKKNDKWGDALRSGADAQNTYNEITSKWSYAALYQVQQ